MNKNKSLEDRSQGKLDFDVWPLIYPVLFFLHSCIVTLYCQCGTNLQYTSVCEAGKKRAGIQIKIEQAEQKKPPVKSLHLIPQMDQAAE